MRSLAAAAHVSVICLRYTTQHVSITSLQPACHGAAWRPLPGMHPTACCLLHCTLLQPVMLPAALQLQPGMLPAACCSHSRLLIVYVCSALVGMWQAVKLAPHKDALHPSPPVNS